MLVGARVREKKSDNRGIPPSIPQKEKLTSRMEMFYEQTPEQFDD
jgi:hypothetical protein